MRAVLVCESSLWWLSPSQALLSAPERFFGFFGDGIRLSGFCFFQKWTLGH
jgi:hypothetical protein